MGTTFQKRQKEMKRLDKQRMKSERRAQKKKQSAISRASQPESFSQDVRRAPSTLVTAGESHD